jgi:hypothetical protein
LRTIDSCDRCHGELELLRQQAGSLERAQELLVPHALVATSTHGTMRCNECHTGYTRFPHNVRAVKTATCSSCHAPADSAWQSGAHATADDPVRCAQCHTIHDVVPVDSLRTRHGAGTANKPCVSCHENQRFERHAAHADSVACAACHGPHDVKPVDDPESWMAPALQRATCGSCHDSIAASSKHDIHGDVALRSAHLAGREPAAEYVVCTSCHNGHRMYDRADPEFAATSVDNCISCHEHAGRTFFNSYHGKATVLGSHVAATCADCHGAHDILPDTMAASHVAPDQLIETCSACHPYARAAFVKYDPHPDPFNRARNPWIFYSFWFMNGLLIFVLLVFGAHTVLWWIRIVLDQRRAARERGA